MANNLYFYTSGLISLALFFLFTAVVFLMMLSSPKADIFALKKDNYISISLEMPKKITSPKKSVVAPVVKESVKESKEVSVDDLFNDVWTKEIQKTKKKIKKTNNKRLLEIGKKSKIVDKKDVKKVIEQKNINNAIEKSDDSKKDSTATVVNEYLAKIQGLVYENFIPPPNSQGNSVKAVIELSPIGKVIDFRILNYSASSSLNDESDKVKSRLMGLLFPVNPKNIAGSYIIILKSKE